MDSNSKNKIRRIKVGSDEPIKNINNSNSKKKNSVNNKNKSINRQRTDNLYNTTNIRDKDQFELEREIYYRKKQLKRKRRTKTLKKLIPLFVVLAIVIGTIGGGTVMYLKATSPKITKEMIYDNYISSEVVSSEQIPDDLKHAIVAMEDRRFYKHNGIDYKSLLRAFINNVVTSSTQGGSTIDMQLSKNLLTSTDKTYQRKIRDMYNAVCMEKVMTKDEILTAYLNNIYLGKSAYGVAKGAEVFFNKDVSELNLAQCAMLAGITNNPYRYSEHGEAKARQIQVLDDMLSEGYINKEEYQEAYDDPTLFASEID